MENRIAHKMLASLVVAAVVAVGCAAGTDLSDDFGTLNGSSLELSTVGGLAGLQVHQLVRHDERTYVSTTRRICSPVCAPVDSIAGALPAAADDSLFNIAWQQDPFAMKDDYGHTPGSADMVTYTLTVTFNGRTKSLTADDGTMPAPMRTIVESMRGIINAAAGR
jgi:hypothetical protein